MNVYIHILYAYNVYISIDQNGFLHHLYGAWTQHYLTFTLKWKFDQKQSYHQSHCKWRNKQTAQTDLTEGKLQNLMFFHFLSILLIVFTYVTCLCLPVPVCRRIGVIQWEGLRSSPQCSGGRWREECVTSPRGSPKIHSVCAAGAGVHTDGWRPPKQPHTAQNQRRW